MQNENRKKRFAGKGYYIALIACLAAVGISGYVFVRTVQDSAVETMAVPAAVESQIPSPSLRPSNQVTASPAQTPAGSETPVESSKETARETAGKQTIQSDPMEDTYEETMGEAVLTQQVLWPLDGVVVATFSREQLAYSQTMADWRTHEGLDLAAPLGTPVTATQDGTVTAVYEDDLLGHVVVVSHSGDLATRYANLDEEIPVQVGDWVLAGEVLGQVGDSALLEAAEDPHLHLEVFSEGVPVDPLRYLTE